MTTWYNRRPYGSDVQRTISEDTRYTVRTADFGFSDADRGHTLSAVRIDTLPSCGSLWLGGMRVCAGQTISRQDIDLGRLVYAPPADGSGAHLAAFTFSVRDSGGAYDSCPNCFSLNICASNAAPVAVDDQASTQAGQAITVDVRANDRDPDNTRAELKVTGATLVDASKGSVVVNDDGTVTFRPAAGVTGNVEIDYTIKDPAGLADTGRLSVCVQPAATGPQCLTFDFSGNTATDGADGNVRAYSVSGVSVKVTAFAREDGTGAWSKAYVGAYGGGLGVTDASEGSGGNNSHTTDNQGCRDNYLVFSFDQQVVLDKAYLGYVVCDSDMQVWIGTVDGAYAAPPSLDDNVLRSLGFTEVNATTLSGARWAELNAGGLAGNVIVVAADTTDTTPEDAFKLQKLAVCTVPAPVEHPPEGADARRTVDEDSFYAVMPADLGFRDADPGQTLAAVRIDTLPAQGTLTLGGVAVAAGQVVSVAALQAGLLHFTPAPDANGTDYAHFTFSVQDSSGAFDLVPNTFVIDVIAVNDAPVARPDTGTVSEDGVLVVAAADGVIASGSAPAGRDSDLDGDPLQVSGVAFGGSAGLLGRPIAGDHGTLTLQADGAYRYQPAAATQALDDGESVQDVFTYTVTDGHGGSAETTLTVTVTGANDAPATAPDVAVTPENTPVSGNVLGNDSDPDDEGLSVAAFSVQGLAGSFAAGSTADIAGIGSLQIGADGQWSFNPAPGYAGPVPPVTYLASDGTTTTPGTLTITVTPVNLAPAALPDALVTPNDVPATGNVLGNDSDPDQDPIAVTGFTVDGLAGSFAAGDTVTLPGAGTLTLRADGSFTYVPAPGYVGPLPTVQYTISDGQLEAASTLTILVADANTPPAIGPAELSLSEEGLPGGLPDGSGSPDTTDARSASGNFTVADANGDAVTVTLHAPTQALSVNGQALAWAGDGTGTLVGSAGGQEIVRVAVSGTSYTVQISGPIDHPVAGSEDALRIDIGLTASDGRASTDAVLSLTVEDDAPVAAHVVQNLVPGTQQTNVLLVLDMSGSMTENSGVFDATLGRTLTRLELERQAIERLLDEYDARGDVRVRIVSFSTFANEVGDGWTDVATARELLATLTPIGFTNYDAPLEVAVGAFGDAGKLDFGQNVAYFLSDGNPNTPDGIDFDQTNPDIGIQPDEEAAWRAFLDTNAIQAIALGLGGAGVTQANLDPVAYDGEAGVDRDGIVVTDLAQLSDVLVSTVSATASGRLGTGATAGSVFGADGGHVRSIAVDGVIYTYDPTGDGAVSASGPAAARFDTLSNSLRIETQAGGVLVVDLDDGNYRYGAPALPVAGAEHIEYTLLDHDGDAAQGSLDLAFQGSSLVGHAGVSDVFRWTLVDAGTPGAPHGSQVSGFETGSDKLDLRDLLQGESASSGNLDAFLAVQPAENGTTLLVSSHGGFGNGATAAATADVTITLDADLAGALGLGPGATSSQVLQELLRSGKLLVDA